MIDLTELQQALTEMQPRQKLFEIIKAELKRRGHWKNLKRGWQADAPVAEREKE